MSLTLPRILYALSALCWIALLRFNPVTVFMAACLACLSLPVYRRLKLSNIRLRTRLNAKNGWSSRIFAKISHCFPVVLYTSFIAGCLLLPVIIVAVLVSPQAVAGLARLRELKAANFQMPQSWLDAIESIQAFISEYPALEKALEDGMANLDSLFSDTVTMLVTRSFGFVGGTMNAFWLLFLFFTLCILFTVHARTLRKVSARILGIPTALLCRFTTAIHKALKAITLGIVLVALVQGTLCGIAFAVAGVKQPAFWGMLATMVAPIPFIGTALVWLPLCISLWFSGNTVASVGLALWGGIVVAGVDNVLRPLFLGQGIQASYFVLILAILCGLSVFGAAGLITGPVLLALAIQSLQEANRYYKADK